MGDLTAIFIVGFLVFGTYKLFELFVRKGERLAIIEKLFLPTENKEISGSIQLPNISFEKTDTNSWSLRISLLLIGVGLGCLLAFFTQYAMLDPLSYIYDKSDWAIRNSVNELKAIILFSYISIFGGLGLLIAHIIEFRQAKKK
jgi:hypothetical protein